jgi:UDP-N-acetylmuramate dehydrogenase
MNKDLKKLLPGVKENISLKDYNTFKIGGKAKYFFVATKKEDLIKAVDVAKKFKLPFFILGRGSNLLISDKGFKGLVVKIQNSKATLRGVASDSKNQKSKIVAEAGTLLSQLLNIAVRNNLTGFEWAVGIPGTLGGAIYGNAGAFGKSIRDNVKEVEVYDIENEKIKILRKKDCHFDYRESIFKKKKNLIIISAKLELKKARKKKIKQRIEEYLDYRIENQPLNFPSIGSIFKNPKGFFAGELIEKCGLKGKIIGNVGISRKHANFIVNLGNGKAKDVKKLINLIKKMVKNKFAVTLEKEIQYL